MYQLFYYIQQKKNITYSVGLIFSFYHFEYFLLVLISTGMNFRKLAFNAGMEYHICMFGLFRIGKKMFGVSDPNWPGTNDVATVKNT